MSLEKWCDKKDWSKVDPQNPLTFEDHLRAAVEQWKRNLSDQIIAGLTASVADGLFPGMWNRGKNEAIYHAPIMADHYNFGGTDLFFTEHATYADFARHDDKFDAILESFTSQVFIKPRNLGLSSLMMAHIWNKAPLMYPMAEPPQWRPAHIPEGPVASLQPIVAYRKWGMDQAKKFLLTAEEYVWAPFERNEAICGSVGCGVRTECTCGFYALKALSDIAEDEPVIGEIHMWGRVIECEHGYRAQYAYPKCFYDDGQAWLPELAERYGVPVVQRQTMAVVKWEPPKGIGAIGSVQLLMEESCR